MSRRISAYAWVCLITGLTIILACMLSGCASVPVVTRVEYSSEVLEQIVFIYDHVNVEFAFCGFGYMRGDTLEFQTVEMASVGQTKDGQWKAYSDSIYSYCPTTALVKGHSHPKAYGRSACGFSPVDLKNIAVSPQPVGMVLCYDPTDKNYQYHTVWLSKNQVLTTILPKLKEAEDADKRSRPPPHGGSNR